MANDRVSVHRAAPDLGVLGMRNGYWYWYWCSQREGEASALLATSNATCEALGGDNCSVSVPVVWNRPTSPFTRLRGVSARDTASSVCCVLSAGTARTRADEKCSHAHE